MVVSDAIVSSISVWAFIVGTHIYPFTCRHLVTANDQETSVCCILTDLLIHDLEEYTLGFNSVQFTSQEILLNQTFRQSAAVFFSGWEYSVGVWGL